MEHAKIFNEKFCDENIPPWICPFCNEQTLKYDRTTTKRLLDFETRNAIACCDTGQDIFHSGLFSTILKFDCDGEVLCAGDYCNDEGETEEGRTIIYTLFSPRMEWH